MGHVESTGRVACRHLLRTGVLCLMLAARAAESQIAVSPLPGPASCYPGTAGADATIFLREDIHRIDCDAFLGGRGICLVRREFPSDGPIGHPISLFAPIILRPSISGDGVSVYFTEFGFNVCGMMTASEDDEGCFSRDLLVFDPHSIAVSPFGSPLATVPLDESFTPSNQVLVADAFTLTLLEQHTVQVPGPGGGALQVESMDFSVNQRWILVDALNPVTGLWGIFAVERSTGATRVVVAPVAGWAVRNAAFAQTSDDYATFDAQELATGTNTVYAAHLLTGDLTPVATTALLAYPSYTGDDSAIVFTEFDAGTESQASLDIQPLAGDRMTPQGARSRWLTDGGVGVIYRRGTFDGQLLNPLLCPEPTSGLLGAAALLSLAHLRHRRRSGWDQKKIPVRSRSPRSRSPFIDSFTTATFSSMSASSSSPSPSKCSGSPK